MTQTVLLILYFIEYICQYHCLINHVMCMNHVLMIESICLILFQIIETNIIYTSNVHERRLLIQRTNFPSTTNYILHTELFLYYNYLYINKKDLWWWYSTSSTS